MNRFALVAAILLVAATLTFAQFGSGLRYDAASVSALVDRVHADLNQAYGMWHFSNADRDRLNHSEKELRDFAEKWQHGKFDKGQLNEAIDSVQHVLDQNKMPADSRNAISEDLSQLRKMREAYERHEIEGARH